MITDARHGEQCCERAARATIEVSTTHLCDTLLAELSLLLRLDLLVDLGSLGGLVTVPLSGPRRGLVVGLLGLGLALLLLRRLVELVRNRLLVAAVEVLVRVLDALLVRGALVLRLGAAVRVLVGAGAAWGGVEVGRE